MITDKHAMIIKNVVIIEKKNDRDDYIDVLLMPNQPLEPSVKRRLYYALLIVTNYHDIITNYCYIFTS